MNLQSYIGIDRQLALLVIIDALHRKSYYEVQKTLLAGFVKNTDLIRWYPENRELPAEDPYKGINFWIDDLFKDDIPDLEKKGFVEVKNDRVILTERGRTLVEGLLELTHYKKFSEQVDELCRRKHGLGFNLLRRNLLDESKIQIRYKTETELYNYVSLKETLPVGITIDPQGFTPQVDIKKVWDFIETKLEKKEILRAGSDKSQVKFLLEICEAYANSPLSELPIVEVCGHCIRTHTNTEYGFARARISLFIDGVAIIISANGLQIEPSDIQYHGLRVQGMPQIKQGLIEIEAIRIFDRGKYYPSKSGAL